MTATADRARIPAKPPLAAPAATGFAVFFAIILIAAGMIAGRDVLVWAGAIRGPSWTAHAVEAADGLTPQGWMLPGGVAILVLGLLTVVVAVKPRRRSHRPLRIPDTWMTPRDVVTLAGVACQSMTGVAAATATGSARRIVVALTPVAGYDIPALKDAAQAVVTASLAALDRPPRVDIRVRREDHE